MDLYRKVLLGMDELVQKGKTMEGGGVLASEDVPGMHRKEVPQVGAGEGASGDHAGVVVPIGKLPRFPEIGQVGGAFSQDPAEAVAAPDLGLEDGLELQWLAHDCGLDHAVKNSFFGFTRPVGAGRRI
jgi:hypothetical protein